MDYDCGNIDFPGSVWVKGDIKSGFTVKARQNVKVEGSVENANVHAGQDVQVKHGFTGAMRGLITADRNVILGFAHYQKIEAKEELSFEVELLGCEVKVGKCIKSKGGRIVGGETHAVNFVEARMIGSEEEIYTKVFVGQKNVLAEEKVDLENQINEKNQLIDKNKKLIYDLVSKKIFGKLTQEQTDTLEGTQAKNDEIQKEIDEITAQIAEIDERITGLKEAYVRVNGIMYPQCEIHIGQDYIINKEKQRFLMLQEKDGEITKFGA